MADDNKLKQLQALKRRMERALDSPLWFFRSENGVDGYWGTDPVMFVGERPSLGGYVGGPGRAGRVRHADQVLGRFFGLLKEYGFARAHVTDIVKEQMRVGVPSDEQVERNWPYFLEELKIVEPKIIVAVGGWVYRTLEQRLNRPASLRRVTHYSYRFISRSELEERLHAELQMIRKDCGPA